MDRQARASVSPILCVLLAGCCATLSQDRIAGQLTRTAYIDERIILKTSTPISPSDSTADGYMFDLSTSPLVRNRDYNDIEVTYTTPTSCDEDVTVLRPFEMLGARVGRRPIVPSGCNPRATRQGHLVSVHMEFKRDPRPRSLVDKKGRIWLRARGIRTPEVRALKINPDYLWLQMDAPGYGSGLAYLNGSLWMPSGAHEGARIYGLSPSEWKMEILRPPPGDYVGIAFGDGAFWLCARPNKIVKLAKDGRVICDFTVPVDSIGGLAWVAGRPEDCLERSGHPPGPAADRLWLCECDSPMGGTRLFELDPTASCERGSGVIVNTLYIQAASCSGIAWTGKYLLVASDRLYAVTLGGEIARAYRLPVKHVAAVTWDGEAVWLLSEGPKGCSGHDQVVNRFRLR